MQIHAPLLISAVAAALVVRAVSAGAGEALAELNFADMASITAAKVTTDPAKPNERASGVILRPLYDNSNWCAVWTEYSVESREGISFQRIKVVRIDSEANASATGQAVCYLPDIEGATRYELTLKVRSPDAAELRVDLRQRGKPYTYFWSRRLTPAKEWQEFTFEVTAEPTERTAVGLYLRVPKVGTIDIAALKLEKK